MKLYNSRGPNPHMIVVFAAAYVIFQREEVRA